MFDTFDYLIGQYRVRTHEVACEHWQAWLLDDRELIRVGSSEDEAVGKLLLDKADPKQGFPSPGRLPVLEEFF